MGDFNDALFQLKTLASGAGVVNAQKLVEGRILALMAEFPTLADSDVATLTRDEILNAVGEEPALLKWATDGTVARLRRTLMLAALRREQAQALSTEYAVTGGRARLKPDAEKHRRACRAHDTPDAHVELDGELARGRDRELRRIIGTILEEHLELLDRQVYARALEEGLADEDVAKRTTPESPERRHDRARVGKACADAVPEHHRRVASQRRR